MLKDSFQNRIKIGFEASQSRPRLLTVHDSSKLLSLKRGSTGRDNLDSFQRVRISVSENDIDDYRDPLGLIDC
jgi:hypothetical protein